MIKSHAYRGYSVSVTNATPFFQAEIHASNPGLPDVDWKLRPIRAAKLLAAVNLAKRRIDDALAKAAA